MISPTWLSALLIVIFLSAGVFLHGSIQLLKPSAAIQNLALTIDQAMTIFHAHTSVLETFNCKLLLYVSFNPRVERSLMSVQAEA